MRSLSAQGVCVGHYLEMAFARIETALALCKQSAPVEPEEFDWLLSQGDFAAQALAKGGGATDPIERTRLLELLLCVANLHEYTAHHSVEAARPTKPGETTRSTPHGESTPCPPTGRSAAAR
jgi:hypothetical protein